MTLTKEKAEMINSVYAKAYTEVLEIISHFPKEEFSKIPLEKIEYYQKNMDKDYQFTINPKIDLSKQNISKEANAIIITLFRDYYATEEQKNKINEILKLNQITEENAKRKKYNPDDIFKNRETKDKENENSINNTQLIEYHESFFIKFKNFIKKLLLLK